MAGTMDMADGECNINMTAKAHNDSSQPAAPAHDVRPFEFFELPRELRDCLYDAMTADHVLKIDDGTVCIAHETKNPVVAVEGGPRLAYLLLNRQFTAEYTERVEECAILTVEASGFCGLSRVPLNGSVQSVRRVDCRLTEDMIYTSDTSHPCCSQWLAEDIELHRKLLANILAQLPSVESLTIAIRINVYLSESNFRLDLCDEAVWKKVWEQPCLDALNKVAETLSPQNFTVSARVTYADGDREVCMTWIKLGGWSQTPAV
ncbi:hypothetical protein LTR08_008002 [Meristemomyces frigidus]|nr:hypothetical protein LTR08_008002 [Meristemomyces frigidus]